MSRIKAALFCALLCAVALSQADIDPVVEENIE